MIKIITHGNLKSLFLKKSSNNFPPKNFMPKEIEKNKKSQSAEATAIYNNEHPKLIADMKSEVNSFIKKAVTTEKCCGCNGLCKKKNTEHKVD